MIHKHDIKTWFGSNEQFKTYFETEFKTNKLNGLKFPAWYAKQFDMTNSDATIAEANVVKGAASLGNTYINAIVRAKKILGRVDFNWLLPAHKEALKETVCGAIQHAILNKNVFERINSSTISVGTFTVNNDSTSWLISNDMLGQEAWNSLQLADLDKYEIVGDGFIGRVSYDKSESEIVLYKWNNVELGKELSSASHLGIPYDDFQRAVVAINSLISTGVTVDKYDYIYMLVNGEKALMRYEGNTWTNFDNWERKDVKYIDSNQYLVYRDYVLAGSGGSAPGSSSGSSVDLSNYLTRTEATIAFPLKNDVYTKLDTYSKSEINALIENFSWLTDNYADVTEFGNAAPDNTIVKYNLNQDGTNNAQSFLLLIKTAGGVKSIRTWEEIEPLITKNSEDIIELRDDLDALILSTIGGMLIDKAYADAIVPTHSVAAPYLYTIDGVDIPAPASGSLGQIHLQNADGSISFNLPVKFKYGESVVVPSFKKGDGTEAALTIRWMAGLADATKFRIQIESNKSGFFVDNTIRMTKLWTEGGGTVDLTSYATKNELASGLLLKEDKGTSYTKTESDNRYALAGTGGSAPVFTNSKEIFDSVDDGTVLADANTKSVNAKTAVEIINNQKDINNKFLSEFTDELFYKSDTVMEYKDKDLDLVTLDAAITTTGTSVAYSSLISPYDRINQDQASFEVELGIQGQEIEYLFTSKGKAVKFVGNAGQKYKWETVTKFDSNGARQINIKFTGSATIQVSSDALNPSPSWTTHAAPYEIPLSDLMDENNRTALVQMKFSSLPVHGTKVATIDYKTATHFYVQREAALLKSMEDESDYKYAHKMHNYLPASFSHQTGFLIGTEPSDIGTLKVGDLLKFDLSKINDLLAIPTTIANGDALYIGIAYPVVITNSAGQAKMKWVTKTNATDPNVHDNYNDNDLVVRLTQNKLAGAGPDDLALEFVRWEKKAAGAGALLTQTLRITFGDGTFKDFKVGG